MDYKEFIQQYAAFLRFRMDVMNLDIDTIAIILNRHPKEIHHWFNPNDPDNLPNLNLRTLSKLAVILNFEL